MLAEDMAANPNRCANVLGSSCRDPMSLPQKGPTQDLNCDPIHSDKQLNLPKSCKTEDLTEEPPPWLEDLLNEPDSPVNKAHRRSASDSFTYFAADSSTDELWFRNFIWAPACSFQMPLYFNDAPQASFNSKKSNSASTKQQQDKLWKSPSTSTSPSIPNGLISGLNAKEDADSLALGTSCSPEPDRVRLAGSKPEMENSSGGSDCSHLKPPSAFNTDAKRKQQNARRSRVRKLQYIAELERNAQVLQAAGAEVSAQLEFLDQQNILLGMENRVLKQRLENLSQEHFIKSMEQEILDKELASLQYLYQMQRNLSLHQPRPRQKQNPAVHRRGRSYNDVDSQLAKLSLHPPRAVASSNETLQ